MNRETKLKKLVEPWVEALIVGILFCSTRILPCRKGFDEQSFRYVLEATNLWSISLPSLFTKFFDLS